MGPRAGQDTGERQFFPALASAANHNRLSLQKGRRTGQQGDFGIRKGRTEETIFEMTKDKTEMGNKQMRRTHKFGRMENRSRRRNNIRGIINQKTRKTSDHPEPIGKQTGGSEMGSNDGTIFNDNIDEVTPRVA